MGGDSCKGALLWIGGYQKVGVILWGSLNCSYLEGERNDENKANTGMGNIVQDSSHFCGLDNAHASVYIQTLLWSGLMLVSI